MCGKALNLTLAGSAALAAGALIFTAASPQQGEVFSEFYILGAGGMADDYVQEIVLSKSGEVTVGVVNREQCAAVYDVKIFIEGRPAVEAFEQAWGKGMRQLLPLHRREPAAAGRLSCSFLRTTCFTAPFISG